MSSRTCSLLLSSAGIAPERVPSPSDRSLGAAHRIRWLSRALAILALGAVCAAAEEERPLKRTPWEGMHSRFDIKYLPDDRYSGDMASRRGDYEMLLDLHVPKNGSGPFPVVMFVHGGSWSGGSKEDQPGGMAKELASRGIATCGFNYLLIPKGVWPQIYWDFHNAARFLRKNAAEFNIDPLRFGAYGISAGGWLISTAGMPDGDHWQTGGRKAQTTAAILAQGGRVNFSKPAAKYGAHGVCKPIRDPAPAWPGEAGGYSALSWDFFQCVEAGDESSPTVQQWVGMGGKPRYLDVLLAAGGRVAITELTHTSFAGKEVHCPPLFPGLHGRDKEKAQALDLDGKPGKTLGVVMADFFVRELMTPAARPPSPEIYPIPRLIGNPTAVTMLAPRGAVIHYTIDGSQPTAASPVYQNPFTVVPGTTVKAISVAAGMTPSGVQSADFVAGDPPPSVTGPDVLPPGETGQPCTLTFQADCPKPFWQLTGDLAPHSPGKNKELIHPNGMRFDADAGVWSGTPLRPGNYWVQIWVAEGPGMMAAYRNYRWTVTGKNLDRVPAAAGEQTDRNQTFATVRGWPAAQTNALLAAYGSAGLRVLTPGTAGDAQLMLVVHADDRSQAVTLLKEFIAEHPELTKGMELEGP